MAFRKIHLKSYTMANSTACSMHLRTKEDEQYISDDPRDITCFRCLHYLKSRLDPHHQLVDHARRDARQTARSQALGILRDKYRDEYDRLVEQRFDRIFPAFVSQEHKRRGMGDDSGWCAECGARA